MSTSTAVGQARLRRDLAADEVARARIDPALVLALATLVALGLVMVASASVSIGAREYGAPLHYLWRQGSNLGIALAAAAATGLLPVGVWRRWGPVLLVAGAALLALVLVPGIGREINGSFRWLKLGPVSFQPSELVKLFAIVYLAGYLERRDVQVRNHFGGFIRPVLVLGVVAVLLLAEPDYGATVVLFATALGLLFMAGVPLASFLGGMLVIVCGFAALMVTSPYRMERFLTFLDPWADPFGRGFQLTQSLIAIGRGDWLGVGLGNSVQKLFYLPEAHTDFLFAVLAEELGLVGVVLVIGLYATIALRALAVGRSAAARGDLFAAYLAWGIGLLLTFQAYVNIGVNLGLLPTKGITLPLMSYGGSSLVTSGLEVALLVRVDLENRGAAS